MTKTSRHLALPPIEVPILEWWIDCYDHVFVVLNPFFRVPGFRPETATFGPQHIGPLRTDQILDLITSPRIPGPNEAPDDFSELIKSTGNIVRWSDVQAAIGAEDWETFCRAVWLWTVGVDRGDCDKKIVADLSDYCRQTGTYPPEEDVLPYILEPVLGRFLSALGVKTAQLWNEWRTTCQEVPVGAFAATEPGLVIPQEKISAVAAPGFLITWEFDDVAGLLCLTDSQRAKADPAEFFEGFWVTRDMYGDVFNPTSFCERQKPKPQT